MIVSYYGFYTVATKSGATWMTTVFQGIEEEIKHSQFAWGFK